MRHSSSSSNVLLTASLLQFMFIYVLPGVMQYANFIQDWFQIFPWLFGEIYQIYQLQVLFCFEYFKDHSQDLNFAKAYSLDILYWAGFHSVIPRIKPHQSHSSTWSWGFAERLFRQLHVSRAHLRESDSNFWATFLRFSSLFFSPSLMVLLSRRQESSKWCDLVAAMPLTRSYSFFRFWMSFVSD